MEAQNCISLSGSPLSWYSAVSYLSLHHQRWDFLRCICLCHSQLPFPWCFRIMILNPCLLNLLFLCFLRAIFNYLQFYLYCIDLYQQITWFPSMQNLHVEESSKDMKVRKVHIIFLMTLPDAWIAKSLTFSHVPFYLYAEPEVWAGGHHHTPWQRTL